MFKSVNSNLSYAYEGLLTVVKTSYNQEREALKQHMRQR